MLDKNLINKQTLFSRSCPAFAVGAAYLVLRHVKEKLEDPGAFYFFSNHGACTNINSLPARLSTSGRKDCLHRLGKDNLFRDNGALSQAFLECSGDLSPTLSIAYANSCLSNGSSYGWVEFLNNYLKQWRSCIGIEIKNKENVGFFEKISFAENKLKSDEQVEKVSIIVPVFNAEKTLRYSVQSLLNQSYENIEIILVDDCSTDLSYQIAKDLSELDSRITVLRNSENFGAYAARNRGLSVASGDLITVHDADDLSFPNRIAHQVFSIRNSNAIAHLGGYFRVNGEGYLTGYRLPSKFSYDGFTHQCLVSLMIKADFFRDRLGCWDEVRFGADAELLHRLRKISPVGIVEDWQPIIIALDSPLSLTSTPATKLGGEARNEYAQNFLAWHSMATTEELRLIPGSSVRKFAVPSICVTKN